MNIKRLIMLFFLWNTIPLLGADQTLQKKFEDANALFEKGELEQAYIGYNDLIQQGYFGSALYYNIGNYFYRQGQRGKAVLWYERAKQINPRDGDVQFNLSLAQSHLKNISGHAFEDIILTFTSKEISFITFFFIWVFFISLGIYFLGYGKKQNWISLTLWTSGFCLVLSLTWFGVALGFQSKRWAIVTNPPGEVRNGPGDEYAVGFTIPEGSKVLVLNKRPEWTEVGAPQEGLKGWIPSHHIEEVNPLLRIG